MAQNYTRQSSFADGDTITASLFNNEYNQLVNAFAYSSTDVSATGHRHDGSIGQGGNIAQIGDLDFNNKIVVDGTNNRWGFFVEVAGASVEQIRLQDGVIIPVTTNDIDLGSASLQFKDAYFDGTVNADSLVLSSGATVTAILDEDAMTSNSATALATQQSIKAYVDSQVTAQDLDFQGDSGGALSIDLDSETLTIAGGTGIDTSGAINTLTVSIDSTVATLTGTQTLTNKTLTSPDINGGTIDGAIIGATTAAAGSFTTVAASGNITVGGTVDGRDVAADGTKLDGIESGATADQTAAEIRALVEAATDSNVFTDTDHTKLNGIEALADVTDTANVTAAGALMDSELTNITAVKALNQGVATTDSPSFAGLTATTADINGGTIDGTVIGATTPAAGSFTTISASGEIAANGGVAFGDNDKATFGASDDLQIYHDGVNLNYFKSTAGKTVAFLSDRLNIVDTTGAEDIASFIANGAVTLYHDNALKLSTTSTGIDVTGTVTADGLSVGSAGVNGSFYSVESIYVNIDSNNDSTSRVFQIGRNTTGNGEKLAIFAENGDISFYEDTGTTAKFFWDASAESLGIGTSSPTSLIDAYKATQNSLATFRAYGPAGQILWANGGASTSYLDSDTIIFRKSADGGNTERMRIDSSGNLLVGGTTAATKVTLDKTGFLGLSTLGSATDSTFTIDVRGNLSTDIVAGEFLGGYLLDAYDSAAASGAGVSKYNGMHFVAGGNFGASASDVDLVFATGLNGNATERMRIDSSGNVGIGTTSPASQADISKASGGDSVLSLTSAGVQRHQIIQKGTGDGGLVFYNQTAGSERMRIDSSGNLLVGTTTTSPGNGNTTVGISAKSAGRLFVSGANYSGFNRTSTDGDIVLFRKDGTAVGSIGTASSKLTIGSGATGVRFNYASLDTIAPWNVTTNAVTDGATDLGYTNARFKDLYLSGGVYLGGTGADNHLDDYEEGTFTPAVSGGTTAGTGIYTSQVGTYTKVGDVVHVDLLLAWTAHTGSGVFVITGLPFTTVNVVGYRAVPSVFHSDIALTAGNTAQGLIINNSSQVLIRQVPVGGGTEGSVPLDTSGLVAISLTYKTAA